MISSEGLGEPEGTSTLGTSEELLPLLYAALHEQARSLMAFEPPGHTLQPTALVHEAYLRLLRSGKLRWENRGHFFAAAAEAMRRILVERARRVRRLKRGGHLERVTYKETLIAAPERFEKLIALDQALVRLEQLHPRKAEVVKLRYFAGLNLEETAAALGIALATAKRDWCFARAWIACEMEEPREEQQPEPHPDPSDAELSP